MIQSMNSDELYSARISLFLQPFLFLLASYFSELLQTVSIFFIVLGIIIYFLFLWSALFFFVFLPGTLAFHLLCSDELRLLWVFHCLTGCDHRSRVSLGHRIGTDTGCTDDVVG